MSQQNEQPEQLTPEEEDSLLDQLVALLDLPMVFLAIVSLVLLIVQLTIRTSADAARVLSFIQSLIWAVFILEFALRLFLAEDRVKYLKEHWFDVLVALFPALRIFRIASALAAVRSLQAVRPTALAGTYFATRHTTERLRKTFGRSSFLYMLATTVVVTLMGAVGIFILEADAPSAKIETYGDALWYATGLVTTVGNELYPVSTEGRILASILMVYGVGVFGYIAGTLASYFVRADADPDSGRQGEGSPAPRDS